MRQKPPPPPPPLWRNPRKLGFAIGIAAAVLVSAGAAAVMLNSPGDFSTVPHIKRLTPTQSTSDSVVPPHAPVTAAASTSADTPTPSSAVPQTSGTASPSAASKPSVRPSAPTSHTESTRGPMSFHPTPIPKP